MSLGCFATAGALAGGQWLVSRRQLVDIAPPSANAAPAPPVVIVPGATTTTGAVGSTSTIVLAEPEAANFLITGADAGDCADVEDPTTSGRDSSRSDTIMVWRFNPNTNQLAVLSFPRDLYVRIPGKGETKINSAFTRDGPQLLIDTIWNNFGVPINHYVQFDFCAFRTLVDAVGGVAVPFEAPARDTKVPAFQVPAGCVTLDAQMALLYVRSRYYQFESPPGSGNWKSDPTGDLGRIARQQDFIRRVLAKVISDELYRPDTLSALIKTTEDYVVVDRGLTPQRTLEFGQALRSIDPAAITTYLIDSVNASRGNASVQLPRIESDNMKAILAIFRGEATLADAPEQVFTSPTTPPATGASTTTTDVTDEGVEAAENTDDTDDTDPVATDPEVTAPTVVATENTLGISPDPTATCN